MSKNQITETVSNKPIFKQMWLATRENGAMLSFSTTKKNNDYRDPHPVAVISITPESIESFVERVYAIIDPMGHQTERFKSPQEIKHWRKIRPEGIETARKVVTAILGGKRRLQNSLIK